MAVAIAREIEIQKEYLGPSGLQTIYFGGGTPSLLNKAELDLIINSIHKNFTVDAQAEITLEANPDDLNFEKLTQLTQSGINRLSIGTQSFHEPHLKYLNRAHHSEEAVNSVKMAQDIGITNISIDLIYAIPALDHSTLVSDIAQLSSLNIPHVSAYSLTIEPQTVFGNWLKKNKIKPIDDEFSAQQFEILVASLATLGYEQYEISNFAVNQQYSRHNSSYWQSRPYLGVGPSAHSYNKETRSYTISNNGLYLKAIAKNEIPATTEILTTANKTNEYLLTGLRTKWGVSLETLSQLSGDTFMKYSSHALKSLQKEGLILLKEQTVLLTSKGKLFADRIASDLFLDDE
tara:strand:- start:2002 stop:3042 length:1041 start_codon:yes stop_codon:yes gene_type:complete